jgi:hypothetical protein
VDTSLTLLNFAYEEYAEKLSFPSIYYGQPWQFTRRIEDGSTIEMEKSPYKIAHSEIRRRDRRGVTPTKILYPAINAHYANATGERCVLCIQWQR